MKFSTSGRLLQLWAVPLGEGNSAKPGEVNWVHGMAVDSKGNIYAVDILGQRAQKFVPQEPIAPTPSKKDAKPGEYALTITGKGKSATLKVTVKENGSQPPPNDGKKPAGLAEAGHGMGKYYIVDYPASTEKDGLIIAVTYTLWIPPGLDGKPLRGVIVHQHGAGTTASKEGSTAAYDLHWQALAKKWDCALLGPVYHVLNEGDLGKAGSTSGSIRGAARTRPSRSPSPISPSSPSHPELTAVPWVLWGHSAGGAGPTS